MTISVRVLKDTQAPSGARLFCVEATYPRFIHSEVMTHRDKSKNAASSRAIPAKRTIQDILNDMAMPVAWGKNQSGMSAREELTGWRRWAVEASWRFFGRVSTWEARWLAWLGLHKQITNRVLEPWMHMTTIISGTEWDNFFNLRTHPDAQPEFQALAIAIKKAYDESKPILLQEGEWHLPLIHLEDVDLAWDMAVAQCECAERTDTCRVRELMPEILRKVSVGRCARVSYLTHDGKRDLIKDIELHDRLLESGHMSPFEHQARGESTQVRSGNFIGYTQYRKTIIGEENILGYRGKLSISSSSKN